LQGYTAIEVDQLQRKYSLFDSFFGEASVTILYVGSNGARYGAEGCATQRDNNEAKPFLVQEFPAGWKENK
jgi:hypothetical protein